MTGKEIKALRESLGLTARSLGAKLGVEPATVVAWEREELFPTRRHVLAMRSLREEPAAEGASRGDARGEEEAGAQVGTAIEALADPALWEVIRKLVVYPELRREVEEIAARYEDPRRGGRG